MTMSTMRIEVVLFCFVLFSFSHDDFHGIFRTPVALLLASTVRYCTRCPSSGAVKHGNPSLDHNAMACSQAIRDGNVSRRVLEGVQKSRLYCTCARRCSFRGGSRTEFSGPLGDRYKRSCEGIVCRRMGWAGE